MRAVFALLRTRLGAGSKTRSHDCERCTQRVRAPRRNRQGIPLCAISQKGYKWTMLAATLATLLLQPHAAVPGKQLAALIEQIDRVAASEPLEYGIDTRIRAAEALTPKYPAIAKRELRDATASL